MDQIRSWWEVPCIAHFCYIFRKPFKLPEFEIEELEDTLLLDCAPTPSALLVELFCTFLNGIVDKDITEDNWPFFLKLHIEWRCEYLKEKWNPFSDNKEYKDLTIRQRVEILHKLCHWRLELDDIADLLRGIDGPSLRLEPLGKDSEGCLYWYFYGVRLYKEETKKKKKEQTPAKKPKGKGGATPKSTPASKKKSTPASRTPASRRGNTRGRGSKKQEEEEVNNADAAEEEEKGESNETREENGEGENVNGNTANEVGGVIEPGWHVVCNSMDEWEELVENLGGTKHQETKKLIRNLEDYLPDVERIAQQRDKQFKKKLLAELPRRTSDRIAIKAAQRIEDERHEALAREEQRSEVRRLQAEEERVRQEEADEKRRKKHDEAIQRRKQKQEEQARNRMEEEENWKKALSGEISGPRKAAIGAAEGVSDVQRISEELQLQLVADRDEDLYTAMFKILQCLRAEEDAWVFEEPVTESIAPGYFDVVDKPMDYSTVEKNIERNGYKSRDEFVSDIDLIFDNCVAYNGDDSEYSELAVLTKKSFAAFCKKHFEGEEPVDEEGKGKKSRKKRDSRSPSACKTPELTSESSSEEEESDDDSDESYTEGKKPSSKKSKGPQLKLSQGLQNKFPNMSGQGGMVDMLRGGRPPPPGHFPPGMMPPHFHPNYYQMMQQRFGMKAPPPGSGDPMAAYRYPPPGTPPNMPPRLPPPYPGQPHPELVARQQAMYQRPPPDGRHHMYPPHGHYPPQHGPPPPHGHAYPPFPMYPPRHPHMPHYPPGHAHGPGAPRPHPLSRPSSSGSPGLRSPGAANARQTSSPSGSNPRLTASPAGSNPRLTESPAESHASDQQAPPQLPATPTSQEGSAPSQGEERVRSLLTSDDAKSEPAKSEQAEGENVKGEEKSPDKNGAPTAKAPAGSEAGGGGGAGGAGGAGAAGGSKEMTAEMLHRQQQEYQRYRYQQHMMAMHHHRQQQREGGGAYGSYMPPGYEMGPPPYGPPGPPGHGGMPNHGGSGMDREREAAAAAYYWHQQQQMYGGGGGAAPPPPGGHDPRQMAAEQQRYWHEMEMRKRQHMAAMMKHQRMMQQQHQARHGHAHPPKDGSTHPPTDGHAHPPKDGSAHPPPDGHAHPPTDSHAPPPPSQEGSSPSRKTDGPASQPTAEKTPAGEESEGEKEGGEEEEEEENGSPKPEASEDKPSLPASASTNSVDKKTEGESDLSNGEGLTNEHSDDHSETSKDAESAEKPSPGKQKMMPHTNATGRTGGGPMPHPHHPGYGAPPGMYGGPMPHGSPGGMPNGYMDSPMGGYPPHHHHPGMFPPYPHHPHMDPSMEYRNGLGSPAHHYPPGFFPPHQRMPYYPGPGHSGGMSPYHQMTPPHPHFNPQAQGHPGAMERHRTPSQSGMPAPHDKQHNAALSTEGKSHHPPPTPPLEEEPPAKRSKIEA